MLGVPPPIELRGLPRSIPAVVSPFVVRVVAGWVSVARASSITISPAVSVPRGLLAVSIDPACGGESVSECRSSGGLPVGAEKDAGVTCAELFVQSISEH
ncbi:unnamed protein product [Linum trigynum]|uniref:Uncharacterized protein n=1 Tax=Linum trigynum TaxID=586398 RepID=A0AAV2FY39_9ROSI